MIICICGKSGSGKTTLSSELKSIYGDKVIHIDVDKIAHEILLNKEVKEELIKQFGVKILNNGFIDRKKLGVIIFNSVFCMNILKEITWKYMKREIDEIINKNKENIIILDYLLIYKTDYFNNSDIKILLDIPYEIRKERCILRDNISEYEFDLREKSSIEYNKKDFDYILKSIDEIKKVKFYEKSYLSRKF